MKFSFSFVFMLCLMVVIASCEQYSSKFDNIDIDEILESDRLLKNYFNCIMEKGPCTSDGTELKKILPEAIQTMCEKCSDKQKESIKKIVHFLVHNKQDMWKALTSKYDPEGIYFDKYKKELGL